MHYWKVDPKRDTSMIHGDDTIVPDYDFRKSLCNTLVLLGADCELVELARKSLDGQITKADVYSIRNYNVQLTAKLKSQLMNTSKLTCRVAEQDRGNHEN